MNKYDKLTADLIRARENAERASRGVNGKEIFLTSSGVTLYLPKWERERVQVAATRAGVRCGMFERYSVREWSFLPREQMSGARLYEWLRAFEKALKPCGYCVTSTYSEHMDFEGLKKVYEF